MHKIERSALINFSASKMFDLVNDVSCYPKFLKWCKSSRVISQTDSEMEAELEVAWKVLHKVFSTHNYLKKGESIRLELVSGPFQSMEGCWHFKQLREDACKISMEIEFEFKNSLSNVLFSSIFSQICDSLMDSFIKRAHEVYG